MIQRGISIHVGVDVAARMPGRPLTTCQATAWRMADIAARAGYGEIHVLRGAAATRAAVLGALGAAAEEMRPGDTLFVSFAGHGSSVPDLDGDEPDGRDETWCVHDGDVVDDELAACWRRMPPGARAVVVVESCFGGGSARGIDPFPVRPAPGGPASPPAGPVMRGPVQATFDRARCIARAPDCDHGIRGSVLLLAACARSELAREGLYSSYLLEVWRDGAFSGSYCELHRDVSRRVAGEGAGQTPQILMLGAPDLGFADDPAFHLRPRGGGWRGAP